MKVSGNSVKNVLDTHSPLTGYKVVAIQSCVWSYSTAQGILFDTA